MSDAEAPVHYASDAANTVKDILQAIADGLAPLAMKAQVPLEKLFGWACKMQIAHGIADLVIAAVMITGALFLVSIIRRVQAMSREQRKEKDIDPVCVTVFGTAAIIGLLTGGCALLFRSIICLVAPEWSSVEMIVQMVRGH